MFMILSALAAAAAAPPQTAPADKGNDPVICEGREATEVGTHMKAKRTCMHKSEWDYVQNHTKRELQQINNRGNNPGPALGRNPPQ